MKISYNWLKDYIQLDIQPEALSHILTDIGLEVESVELFQTIKGGLQGIVVGKVLECEKHPNADKLHVTKVDIGAGTVLPIVCGAPNVAAGQTVLVATEGTKLYSGDKEFEIKATKIRGEVSQGMICAEDEIGIGNSHDGIMVLPNEVVAGTLAKDYFNIQDDYVFEIGLTPNRIDAASHIGVARDIAAFLNLQKPCKISKPSIDTFSVSSENSRVAVHVENSEMCPRYTGVVIKGVKIEESPAWLKNRLCAIGQKPINNIVDITNYVLHETAQPLHAFDLGTIAGNEICIKTPTNPTTFVTLDGVQRELSTDDLMIYNAQNPMCIAGVFGGIDSGVSLQTTDIFLESAYFNPVSVRKTARRHGLSTDSSFRFERGVDPNNTLYALKRAAILIQTIAGGTIVSPVFDTHPEIFSSIEVELSIAKIQALIGKTISSDIIKTILQSLDILVLNDAGDKLLVAVPPYRVDVQRQEDIVEEILRIYGYNNIEIPQAIRSSIVYSENVSDTEYKNTIANMLVSGGWYEIMNNSLSRSSYYAKVEMPQGIELAKIINPLSTELDCMRYSMLFSCLETIRYNNNRQMSDLSLFEFGKTYAHKAVQGDVLAKYQETQVLALCMYGKKTSQHWNEIQKDVDIFTIKSIVQKICTRLGLSAITYKPYAGELFSGFECSVGNTVLGFVGLVSKQIAADFDIDKACYYAELYWDAILLAKKEVIRYTEIVQYPEVRRDLALLVDTNVSFESIQALAYATEKRLLKHVNVFDVYQGKGVPEGKKSYAVSFILQDSQKTLTDVQIESVMNKLISKYKTELSAELR